MAQARLLVRGFAPSAVGWLRRDGPATAVRRVAPQAAVAHGQTRSLSYGVIFVAAFALLALVALGGALLGRPWRSWLPGAEGVPSLVGGVKAAVYSFLSYVQ